MEGIKIYAVAKTCKVSCKTIEVRETLYTNEESANRKALELYRMEEEPDKYDYRVYIFKLTD